ncbi:MAG: translation initiation factor IF-3 [Planctomycetota bacterium]
MAFQRNRFREAAPKRERINEQIRLPEVQVIDHTGNNLGVIPTDQAREVAREAGLDLVEINPDTRPVICKIMDYGKYKYEKSKKSSDAKKKQHQIKIKEVRLTAKTEEHDLTVKINHIRTFLEEGDKCQISIQFKGREIVHKERGEMQMQRIIAAISDIGKAEGPVSMQGRRMILLLSPDKKAIQRKKKEEKARIADARARAEGAAAGSNRSALAPPDAAAMDTPDIDDDDDDDDDDDGDDE